MLLIKWVEKKENKLRAITNFNTTLRKSFDWNQSSLLLMIQWKEHHCLYKHEYYYVQDF